MKKSFWQDFHCPSIYIIRVPFLPQKISFLPSHLSELSDLQESRVLQSSVSCLKAEPRVGVNRQMPVFV